MRIVAATDVLRSEPFVHRRTTSKGRKDRPLCKSRQDTNDTNESGRSPCEKRSRETVGSCRLYDRIIIIGMKPFILLIPPILTMVLCRRRQPSVTTSTTFETQLLSCIVMAIVFHDCTIRTGKRERYTHRTHPHTHTHPSVSVCLYVSCKQLHEQPKNKFIEMVLPIAVGGKSCSSRRVLGSSLLSTTKEELLLLSLLEEEEQEKEFEAIPLHDNGLVGVFVCSQQILSATVAITYYELRNRINHKLERTVAQIMIQVSPLSKPLSESQYRRVIHRIVLPSDDNLINNGTPNQQPPLSVTTTTTSIDALFSENRKYLVVRIPHPQQSQPSIGVIFQLRRPRAGSLSTKASLLQPPSYITHDPAMMDARNIIIPVATNPTIIALPDDDNDNNNKNNNSLKHVVGFCQVSTPYSAMLLLLVTCLDGTIRVVSWKQASVAGTLYQSPSPVVRIRHTTTSSSSGRLAMLNQQGQVTILTTKWETHTEAHMMTADEQQEEPFSGQDQQSEEGVLVNGVETHDAHPTNDHVEENEKLSPEADEDDGKSWEEVTDETTTEPNPTRNGDAVDPPSSLDKSNGLAPSEIRETSQTHQDGPVTVETPESRTKDPMMIRLALHFHSTLSGSFADCAWIHDDALALLAAPQSKGDCVAKVWSLNNAKAITALSLTAERLEEIAHGTFDVNDNDENHDEAKLSYGSLGLQSLRYDSLSGCLAVSSLLHPSERYTPKLERCFACCRLN